MAKECSSSASSKLKVIWELTFLSMYEANQSLGPLVTKGPFHLANRVTIYNQNIELTLNIHTKHHHISYLGFLMKLHSIYFSVDKTKLNRLLCRRVKSRDKMITTTLQGSSRCRSRTHPLQFKNQNQQQ